MTDALVRPAGPWTIDDIPDDGYRYEIVDGSLLVPPPPAIPHVRVTTGLRRILEANAPGSLAVIEGAGIFLTTNNQNYQVPDIIVLPVGTFESDKEWLVPSDVVLAVEVVSPNSGGVDHVMKRYQYGKAGIPHYWIVDQKRRTLTVLRHDGAEAYDEGTVVRPGETWQTEEPFPLKLDPADFV